MITPFFAVLVKFALLLSGEKRQYRARIKFRLTLFPQGQLRARLARKSEM